MTERQQRQQRQRWIVGNWKMNGAAADIADFAANFRPPPPSPARAIAVCPPAPYWRAARAALPPAVLVGAQNISAHSAGPRTGEISAAMAADAGCALALVGHSERRATGETSADCRAKIAAAAAAGLRPILCIGEDQKIRAAGAAVAFVLRQLDEARQELEDDIQQQMLVAYEPIWAIGAGITPTPTDIATMRNAVRDQLAAQKPTFGGIIPFLYGGGVNPGNVAALTQSGIDGFLVGGASLRAAEFANLCENAERL